MNNLTFMYNEIETLTATVNEINALPTNKTTDISVIRI